MNYKKGIPRGYLFYFAQLRAPFGRPRYTVRFLDCARNDRWGERAAARRGAVEMTARDGCKNFAINLVKFFAMAGAV